MKEARQFKNILDIVSGYVSKEPLSRFLKGYFRNHRNMGSNDRRQASDFIYHYFRLKNALKDLAMEEQVAIANFILCHQLTPLLEYCTGNFSTLKASDLSLPMNDKIRLVQTGYPAFSIPNIFPFRKNISDKIDIDAFVRSFLKQPHLWIRPGKNYADKVLNELRGLNIGFTLHESGAVALPIKTPLQSMETWKRGYFEVQDLSSQRSAEYFHPIPGGSWWDACAASGGKSLALMEKEKNIVLTVTDVRDSVLKNLKLRFQRTGITGYELFQKDLVLEKNIFPDKRQFDNIIADVPCSGSGTWSRTPERLSQFSEEEILHYRQRQIHIVTACTEYLKKGGNLIYITCSVFREENEEVASYICSQSGLKMEQEEYLKGYDEEADTMYIARFIK